MIDFCKSLIMLQKPKNQIDSSALQPLCMASDFRLVHRPSEALKMLSRQIRPLLRFSRNSPYWDSSLASCTLKSLSLRSTHLEQLAELIFGLVCWWICLVDAFTHRRRNFPFTSRGFPRPWFYLDIKRSLPRLTDGLDALMGAISWANAGFGSARASALVGEGSLRCRAEAP